ncbi:MAG: zinc ribbon domain-containing protein [Actinomycetota bacterium]|nr:zinc ribbon domain-containing protein [Actinomycetota bacterium]
MNHIASLGTYLPPWGTDASRVVGRDEDVVTLAVAAGLGALAGIDLAEVRKVVLVSRDLPLLEGGNSAAVLGGLGLPINLLVREAVGGAPATLSELGDAGPGTLVIGADIAPAGAAAAYVGAAGAGVRVADRITRSMPVATRDGQGNSTDYGDPRLLRVRGINASLDRLDLSQPIIAAAGLSAKDAASFCEGTPPALPTTGASAPLFALAALLEAGRSGRVLAVEQGAAVLTELMSGAATVARDQRPATPLPKGTPAPGAGISIALPSYDRNFDAKVRLEASKCRDCGVLIYPHRFRCPQCGNEGPTDLVALPREAQIYSMSTIRVPVPGLVSPYSLVLAELGDSGVRLLVGTTGALAGSMKIGDTGCLVFRLVATRSGVPDYGYGFLPSLTTALDTEVSA